MSCTPARLAGEMESDRDVIPDGDPLSAASASAASAHTPSVRPDRETPTRRSLSESFLRSANRAKRTRPPFFVFLRANQRSPDSKAHDLEYAIRRQLFARCARAGGGGALLSHAPGGPLGRGRKSEAAYRQGPLHRSGVKLVEVCCCEACRMCRLKILMVTWPPGVCRHLVVSTHQP